MISIKVNYTKDFIFRVLSGVAIGIIAGLVPNAILGEFLNTSMDYHPIFKTLLGVVVLQFNLQCPALIGALVAMKFDLSPLAIAVVASAAYVGSGATMFQKWCPVDYGYW